MARPVCDYVAQMPDLDLKPSEYRVKRGTIRRFLSSRPFFFWAVPCGVWAGGVLYTARNWVDLGPTWQVLAIAGLPAIIMLLVWTLTGGSTRHD